MANIPEGGSGAGGFVGIKDPGKVQDIISRLGKAHTQLNKAKSEADSAAHGLSTHWQGPDSARFQKQWKGDSDLIEKAAADVQAMKKMLDGELAEQKAASK